MSIRQKEYEFRKIKCPHLVGAKNQVLLLANSNKKTAATLPDAKPEPVQAQAATREAAPAEERIAADATQKPPDRTKSNDWKFSLEVWILLAK